MSYNSERCPVCKELLGGSDVSNGYCTTCHLAYGWFKMCALPENWKRLTRGYYPSYSEWREEQIIKSQLRDGLITQEEASKRAAALAKKIAKNYGAIPPDPPKATVRTRPTPVFDLPSILPFLSPQDE